MRTAREIFESLIEDEKRNERRNRRFNENDEPVRRHGRISESRYDRQSMRDIREARERRAIGRSLSDIYESARRQRAIDEEDNEAPVRRSRRVSESLYDAVRRQRRINESQEKETRLGSRSARFRR